MELIRESYLFQIWLLLTAFLGNVGQQIRESGLCQIGRRFAESLRTLWVESALGRAFNVLCVRCTEQLEGSRLVDRFYREGWFARSWQESGICTLLMGLLNLPGWLCHWLYRKLQPWLDGSFFCRLGFAIADRAAILLSWLILLLWIIPYENWNNAYSLMGFLLIVGLFWLQYMHTGRVSLDIRNTGAYATLFFLTACLAVPLSAYPDLSARFLIYYLSAALCVLITVSAVRTRRDLLRLAGSGAAVTLIASLDGILQRMEGVEIVRAYVDLTVNEGMPGRVTSFYDNPNTFAEVLLLLLPVIFALVLSTHNRPLQLFALLAAVLGMVSMGMTYSRASWIGLACAVIVFFLLWRPRLLPLLLLVVVLAVPILPDTITNRILTITNTSDSSTVSRFPLMKAAAQAIARSPVLGAGLGTDAVRAYVKELNIYHEQASFVHAHNIYLQVWLEMGFAGIVSFCGAVLWSIKRAARLARDSAGRALANASAKALENSAEYASVRTLVCGGAAAMAGSMVCSLADYMWNYPRVMCIFWFVFALTLGGMKLLQADPQN